MDGTTTEHVVTYTDPQTLLQVRCACVLFSDYPAAEWGVTLENAGQEDTPLIQDVQALDVELSGEDIVLHRALGSSASRSGLAPVDEPLSLRGRVRLAPVAGAPRTRQPRPFSTSRPVAKA